MRGTKHILAIIFPLYLAIVLFTGFSFTGFWTDIIFSISLAIYSIRFVIKNRRNGYSKNGLRVNVLCSSLVIIVLVLNLLNPFAWSQFSLRSFYFQSVDGRLFNAYFKPVGSSSGGYGTFWVTETLKYFPLIEWEVYYKRTFDCDLNDDTFEGQPIDNYEVVRNYIQHEVIEK